MAFNVGDLIAKIKLDTTGFKDGIKDANNSVGGFSKNTAVKAAAIGAAFIGISIAIKKVATEVGELAEEAGKFQSVEDAFSGMSEGMGIDGEELVNRVKKASSGTITEMKVMQNFLKSSTLIGKDALGENGDNFVRFATIAKKAARATGQDVDFLFESIVNGVGRTSVKWLDNTGVVINATDAYEAYAKEVGANTRVVTRSAKETEKLNARIAENGSKLAIAEQRVKEFSDKTKESTKMSSEATLAKLRNAIATDKARLSQESWTETIKVSSEDLTEEQKKIAITNAFLGKAEKLYENVDASAGGYSSALGRSKVATDELRKAIGLQLIPLVQPLVDGFARIAQALADVIRGKISLRDQLIGLGIDVDNIQGKFNWFREKLIGFINKLKESEETIRKVANVILIIFLPALVNLGIEAVKLATKSLFNLIISIIKLGVKSAITAVVGVGKLIASIIQFIIQGWKSVLMLSSQIAKLAINTGAWIANKIAIIAQTVATTAATAATWLFNAALAVLTSPITLVIIAIGLLVAAVVWLIKNWDMVSAKGKEIWADVVKSWNGMLESLKSIGGEILGAITKPFSDAWEKIKRIAQDIKDEADKINPFHRESPSLVDNVKNGLGVITDEYNKMRSGISGFGVDVSNSVNSSLTPVASGVGGISIYMNGNIGSIGQAQKMGEAMGDQIIGKLKQNIRF